MAKGFGLNASNDIIIGGTEFTRTDSADHLAQKLRSKLQLIRGESQLDTTAGIAYFTDIFVKPVDLPAVASIFKATIINTEGVNELLSFDYDLDTSGRELTISFSISTDYDDISIDDLVVNMGV